MNIMKRIKFLILSGILAMSVSACKKAEPIDLSSHLSENVSVAEASEDEPGTGQSSGTEESGEDDDGDHHLSVLSNLESTDDIIFIDNYEPYKKENDPYYQLNAQRENKYGGGSGADCDYRPRDKKFRSRAEMPETVKALYLSGTIGGRNFEEYIDIGKNSGINAFVVNITDNWEIGYESEVIKAFSPSAYVKANYTREEYGSRIQRLKDEGFYVIGRITTFHDDYLCKDHPEYAICDSKGNLKELSKGFWPSPYCREVWQFKVDLAKEAVTWFDFDEIQFDYVRFPDRTQSAEKEGDIDYRVDTKESKAQCIQQFLMYAVDELHPLGVYVAADVFGEIANSFVGGYGQYWPAISNVVDVICAMPYTDHYDSNGDWNPWEHPYETVSSFAKNACIRQTECPTPAIVRTWIQGYDSYKKPKVEFYAENVAKEIRALYDAGLTNGYMIWNGANDLKHYRGQMEAFALDP